jgi:hypothetical protein
VRNELPIEFRDASYVAVASSQYLIKPGLRFHLWVRTDRPLTCKALKRWLEHLKAPVDVNPLHGVGITYTACPIFEDRAADPLPEGRLVVLKGHACVTVPDYVFTLTDRFRDDDNDTCVEIDSSNVGDRERSHAAKKLREFVEELENTAEGKRNTTLNAIAYSMGRMVGAGWIDYDEVRDALMEACQGRNGNDLPAREARALLRRVIRIGMRKPRDEFVNPWEECREVIEKDGELFDAKTGEAILTITPEDAPTNDDPDYADEILKLPGLVTDIANFILSAAQVPQKRFAVAAGLTIVGMAAARHLKTPTGSQLNTYMLIVTQTANGKDAPLTSSKALLAAAGLDCMIGPSGGASDVAIYLHCNDYPVTLMVIDEFGDILAANNASSANSHTQKINATLKIMWTGGRRVAVPKAVCRAHVVLNDPYLSLLCATTPGRFYGAVGGKEVADGTLNRFLVINVETLGPFNDEEGDIDDIPSELAKRVRDLADRSGPDFRVKSMADTMRLDGYKKPVIVPSGEGAREAWRAYRDQCRTLANKDNCRETFGARCDHNAIKVATILAISENPVDPVVQLRHVKLGMLLADASLRDMMGGYEQNAGDSKTADLQDRVLGRIRKAKGGVISKRELFGSLRRAFDTMQKFDDIMKILAATGEIEVLEIKKGPSVPGPSGQYFKICS